eukprot:669515-Amphidinium_carterae.1
MSPQKSLVFFSSVGTIPGEIFVRPWGGLGVDPGRSSVSKNWKGKNPSKNENTNQRRTPSALPENAFHSNTQLFYS